MNDPVFLSRLQFGITAGFHYLFPPISIGLAWILVIFEGISWQTSRQNFELASKFFAKLFALSFAIGVASGIVLEFQFGMNWAGYSKYIGDIFGAPLAAEAIFSFFLESTFLGLYLFGRNRIPKGMVWFSILMVAVGATMSAFWIIVANSWQHTPTGFTIRNGRAELIDFWAAVFNPSTLPRFFHTMAAALVTGGFFVIGVSSLLLLKNKKSVVARVGMKVALPFSLLFSLLVAFPTGHRHAQQVAQTQPEKFAAYEGLYETQKSPPLVAFGLVQTRPPKIESSH